MKAQRYLVTTSVDGRKKTQVWDASAPMAIDRPMKWVLERTEDGVRVRNLGGPADQVHQGSAHKLNQEQVNRGSKLRLVPPDGSASDKPVTVEIRPVKKQKPAFAIVQPVDATGVAIVLAYTCIGEWVLREDRVDGLFVGFEGGRSVFALKREGDRFDLRVNEGVLKVTDGKQSQDYQAGATRSFSRQELMRTEFSVGQYRWDFGTTPQVVPDVQMETAPKDAESEKFKRSLLALLAFLFVTVGVIKIWPESEKPKEEEVPEQVAKVVLKKKPEPVHRTPIVAPPPKVEREIPPPAPKAEAKPQKAPEQPRQSAQSAPAKAEPVKMVNKPMPASPKLAPADRIAKSTNTRASVGAGIVAPKPKTNSNLAALQSLVGGKMLTGVNKLLAQRDIVNRATGNIGGKAEFQPNAAIAMPTDVNVNYQASNTRVGTIGSGGIGTGVSGKGIAEGPGYGTGEHRRFSGAGGRGVSLDTGGAVTEEGLTKEEVGAVIHAHMTEVRYCYEAAKVRKPNVEGRLVLAFTISREGRVMRSATNSDSTGDPVLGECLQRSLKTWQFPHPKGGINVDVSYPFIFKTLGGG